MEQSVEELERQAAQGDVDIYSDASVRVELAKNSMQADSVAEQKPVAENNMLTLYVVAPEGQQFRGDYVVQSLEALGFQYGEYQIFHRHQHMGNSASPVIFSVANMMQPVSSI
ncbi:cell division protein ZipA [Actinobacillus pleuropneumoniae]|nr:cell division protein ZipA [Actinobacillus pleuropneumoniae]